MEIIRILSISLLMIVNLCLISCYLISTKESDKEGRSIILVLLTIFVIPTIYIILN